MFSVFCFGQDTKGTIKVKKADASQANIIIPDTAYSTINRVSFPLTIVEQMPAFPGGQKEMDTFIKKNLKYPEAEREICVKGVVYVTFVVKTDGTVSDVKLLRGINGATAFNNEALRIVKMMPKWNPGMQNGRTVEVQCNLPIKWQM